MFSKQICKQKDFITFKTSDNLNEEYLIVGKNTDYFFKNWQF